MSQYEKLLKKFDGTIESVPPEIEAQIIDLYAEEGSIQALEGKYDVPAELIRCVLEQPDLMRKALDRRRGEFTLRFVNKVLPAALTKAASGETGAIQAAKLVADAIGAVEGRPIGRPKKSQPESGPSLEDELRGIAETTSTSTAAEKPAAPVKPKRSGKARSKLPRKSAR